LNRTLDRVWDEFIVPVFIERFLIVVCAAAFYGLVITNAMTFSPLQRIGLGIALVGIALFLGATASKTAQPPIIAPKEQPKASGDATTSGPNSPANTGNGNDVKYDQSSPPEKKPPKKE
jgi:hypothetical protein